MKNSDYWKQRFAQLENAQHDLGESAKQEISKMYDRAQAEIEAQIDKWYRRLAKNNEISMAEAKKLLKGKELKEFKWDVGDYIEYGKENAMNKTWMKELENASAKFHISKLEALNIGLEQSLQKLFTGVEDVTANALSDCYKEGYYRTMYELQKGFSVGFDVAKIDDNYVHKVLSKPWAEDGYNFSENIWKYKTKLINVVHNEITNNLLTGADPQKAIDVIAKKMSNSKFNAGRLVMTEEAYFSSLAAGDCFRELDVEKYEILATLDNRTSDICQSMDGKVFDMKDYQASVTAPPFHCFCRSTTVPAFDKDYDIKGSRAARDGDGKTYYVDGDMRYSEWKARFVDKTAEKPAPQEKPQAVPKSTQNNKKPVDKSGESGIINNKIRTYNIHSNSNSRVYSTEELESAMCSSPLGSSMSDYIEQEGLSIEMNYDDNAPQNILGWISGKDISINVVNHKDAYDVSQTIVHECAHRRFNWDTTMEDEINCMIYDYLHIHESISQDAIKEIVSFVKSEYSDLPKGVLYGY